MGGDLKQTVVVENRPSGGGVLANSLVAKAAPDGYTLGIVSSTFTTGAAIRTNLDYDAVRSFPPIAMIAKGPLLVRSEEHTSELPSLMRISYAVLCLKHNNRPTRRTVSAPL